MSRLDALRARPWWTRWRRYLHRGDHRTTWGTHSTAQLKSMLSAGRALQRALADGAATPIAAPNRPAPPAPPQVRGCGPAPNGRSALPRIQRGPATPAADQEHDDQCEAEFIFGPMAYSPCGCAERRTGACGMCPYGEHPHTQQGCDVDGCPCTWAPPPLTDDDRWPGGSAPLTPDASDPWWCTCTPPCWQRPCRTRALAALVPATPPLSVGWWDADTDATAIIGHILAAVPRHAADRLVPMADPALAGREAS